MFAKLFNLLDQKQIVIKFERAINDLRKGLPIIYNNTDLIIACDSVEQPLLDALDSCHKTIIIDKNRAKNIGIDAKDHIGIDIDIFSLEYLNALAVSEDFCNSEALFNYDDDYANILEILRLAKLIPAAILVKNMSYNKELINIDTPEINQYKMQAEDNLHEVCSAPLKLQGVNQARITAFRPNIGGQEHYAIIVGDISQIEEPLVRVHSSCYTGDLLASLSCDCREQLHESLAAMANSKDEAGIVIYLMQEGRGIGLTNKLRTYLLQSKGLDTVDANLALGFLDDERDFKSAAQILDKLNINKIKLISNNSKKATALSEYGIEVTATVPIIIPRIKESSYFKTKVAKLGHKDN